MYAVLVGDLKVGQLYTEIEYKEIAREKEFKNLIEPFLRVMTTPEEVKAIEYFKKAFADNKPKFLSKGVDTLTMYGNNSVVESPKGSRTGSGLRVRIVEVE